jgi:hypothetical protein
VLWGVSAVGFARYDNSVSMFDYVASSGRMVNWIMNSVGKI